MQIDIDRWTQVKISSGLISLASQSGFLRQAERRQHHTGLYFEKASEQLGLGWARLCRGVAPVSKAGMWVASLEPQCSSETMRKELKEQEPSYIFQELPQ